MEYRTLPHGGEKISVIAMGASVIGARPEGELIDTVRAACESGINCFDLPGGSGYRPHQKVLRPGRPGGQAGERALPDPGEDRVGLPACGHRCPFHVPQSQRMETIRTYFGK